METNGLTSLRPRNSPSSERFLGLFSNGNGNVNGSVTNRSSPTSVIGDELEEDDVFWTGNFSQSDYKPDSSSKLHNCRSTSNIRRVDSSGILAALPLDTNAQKKAPENRLLYRKVSLPSPTTSSRMIPSVPRRQTSIDRDFLLAAASVNFRHSAPVNVPVRSKVKGRAEMMMSVLSDDDADADSDKEMLPPHEIVARGSKREDMTFSVLEGVGRTLKGRDLRQVRNAVWRQTGFLD